MKDHEVDIRQYRDGLEADLEDLKHRIWVGEEADSDDTEAQEEAEEAQEELDNWALEVSVQHIGKVLLTYGGPMVWLEAPIQKGNWGWERTGEITLHHSWGGDGRTEIPVWGGSALGQYFDDQIETMGECQ